MTPQAPGWLHAGSITVRRDLPAEPPAVWRALIDVEVWPEWGPSVAGATLDGGGTLLGAGATGTVRTAVGLALRFAVTEWVPGVRWAWRVGGVAATSHEVAPIAGGTRASIGVPWWAPAYAPLCWAALGRLGRVSTHPPAGVAPAAAAGAASAAAAPGVRPGQTVAVSPIELSPAGLTFRRAGPADVEELVALVESAYRGESGRAGWTTEADLIDGPRTDRDEVAGVLRGEGSRMIVASAPDGTVVACCQLQARPAGVAYFGMFAVRPGLQGRGVGRALLSEAERQAAAELGSTTMHMTVIRQRHDLIAWYERLGYARTGQRRPFPTGDGRYGQPTRPDLEFEILARTLPAEAAAR